MNNQPNLEPGKTEAERFLRQPKGTLPTNTANLVKRVSLIESNIGINTNINARVESLEDLVIALLPENAFITGDGSYLTTTDGKNLIITT